MKNIPDNFPLTLDDGKYIRNLNKEIEISTYMIGTYEDKSKKQYIAKIWSGEVKNAQYYELKNELEAYLALWSILSKNIKEVVSNFPDIQIPRLNYSEVSDNQILILIQKIDSKPMELNSIEIRWKSLCRVLEYFKFISNLATDNEVKKIHHKQTWKFILSLPLLMFVALIKHPRLLKELLYASSYLIKKSRYVLFSKNLGLVHRDLNSSNTLYKNGRITILDFQLLSLTVLSHDFGNFFYEMWKPDNSKQLDKLLLSKGVNKLSSEEEFMLIYSVLFDLSFGTEKSEQEAKQYIFHLQEIL